MRSQIILISVLIFSLMQCDQVPSTLDDTPFLEDSGSNEFRSEISIFEFDILTWNFFFTVAVESPSEVISVEAELLAAGRTMATFTMQDSGQGNDILVNDGSFDDLWALPDSMSTYIDSLWSLEVVVSSNGETHALSQNLQPDRPVAPIITAITHSDTLIRPTEGQIRDTIRVEVFLPPGRDSIRDVRFTSLKPDSTYANSGQPIPLYDDGGALIYSGDKVAGDGIYSLILPLESTHLTGTYYWTFYSRTWLGEEAESVEDSLVVIPAESILMGSHKHLAESGVFQ